MERHALQLSQLTAAARALGRGLQRGDVVLLQGPMGAGKTTFTRALAEGLEVRRPDRVRSPTYNLCLVHDGARPLAHVDLFRLAQDDAGASIGSAAFEALGLPDLVDGGDLAQLVLVVEWGDLWADPPADCLKVELCLEPDDFTRRTLVVTGTGPRARDRLVAWELALSGTES